MRKRLLRDRSDYGALEQLDIEIHLAKEGETLSKESKSRQKFIHGIKVLMAKTFLDNLSEEVRKGHVKKIEQGGYPAKAPLGYRNNTATNEVGIDHEKAPYIVRMFELAATGNYSLPHIRKIIAKQRADSSKSRCQTFEVTSLGFSRNPFYTSTFLWKDTSHKGKHRPIVSRELFDKVQSALEKKQKPKYRVHSFAFGGLLMCGQGGFVITAETKKTRYTSYHCTHCKGRYAKEEELAPLFNEIIRAVHLNASARDCLVKTLR